MQPAFQQKQFLKGQPPVGLFQSLKAGGEVDILIGVVDIT